MDDKRRDTGSSRDKLGPGARSGPRGSDSVRQGILRTNWGRVLPQTSHAGADSTLTLPRPHVGARDSHDAETHVVSGRRSRPHGREPRIAILGCGPAGLLAAHAVRLHGFRPDILSIKQKSLLDGAIYLHEPIPYLTTDVKSASVQYAKTGTRDGYAEKVYGHPEAECSWDLYDGSFTAYSMKQAYDILWIKYQHLIKDVDLARHSTPELITQDYQIVISTIPAPVLCMYPDLHSFPYAPIWISPDLPVDEHLRDNTILYNGSMHDFWYRASKIFGVTSTEAVFDDEREAQGRMRAFIPGRKPVENTCTCNPRFHRVGRFGQWKKGILAHQAFFDTIGIMEREGIVDALF